MMRVGADVGGRLGGSRSGLGNAEGTVNGIGNVGGIQVRGMKTRSSVKKLCEGCKVRLNVLCSLCKRFCVRVVLMNPGTGS
jgi:ribosomal protein L36